MKNQETPPRKLDELVNVISSLIEKVLSFKENPEKLFINNLDKKERSEAIGVLVHNYIVAHVENFDKTLELEHPNPFSDRRGMFYLEKIRSWQHEVLLRKVPKNDPIQRKKMQDLLKTTQGMLFDIRINEKEHFSKEAQTPSKNEAGSFEFSLFYPYYDYKAEDTPLVAFWENTLNTIWSDITLEPFVYTPCIGSRSTEINPYITDPARISGGLILSLMALRGGWKTINAMSNSIKDAGKVIGRWTGMLAEENKALKPLEKTPGA